MSAEILVERLFETLINGDRPAARAVVDEAFDQNAPAERVITNLFWPTFEMVDRLYRADQLSASGYNFATRLLRALVDQTASRLRLAEPNGRTILAFSGPSRCEELGAQMAVDLLESKGYQVRFAGGGVPGDEILNLVNEQSPDLLVMFASAASDLPEIRRIIDTIKEIGAADKTKVAVGGGVFNRAEGLAEEIGADIYAADPFELVEVIAMETEAEATPQKRAAAPVEIKQVLPGKRRKAA